MKEVILAKTAGFCFGVRRAVAFAEKAGENYDVSYTYGPLIHNEHVVKMLEAKGVHEEDELENLPDGANVIIRSHGVGAEEYAELQAKNCNIIDATCPDVARIHKIAREASEKERTVIIIGAADHPEVKAISGWCRECVIFSGPEELEQWLLAEPNRTDTPLTVVYQTTGTGKNMINCDKIIKKLCTNCEVFDTICKATCKRQEEAAEIASKVDSMIIVGGKNSANSRRLSEICAEKCKRVFFVESADEIDSSSFVGSDTIGITAGASTPAWIIKEVYDKMSEEIKNEVIEESFEEMLEKSFQTFNNGDKVTGTVVGISPTEVSLEIGAKQSAYIPVEQLTNEPNAKAEDIVKIGDEIEAIVVRVNDVEGTIMLSKKRLDAQKSREAIENAVANGEILEGYVVEENKGGLVVNVQGNRVFVPASQSGVAKGGSLTELLKTKVSLKITECDFGRRGRIVGSIRAVKSAERKAAAEQIWNEIEVGKTYAGTVKSLTSYGAFVDIGGIDGMVHVSELSWNRIKNPAEVVSVGDAIEVYVINFDKDKRKISLGCKKAEDNPWVKFTTNYAVDDVVDVKVVKLVEFGAFAEIIPGVDGLIHISQIANRRIEKPADVLTEGETVSAKIIKIEEEKKRVSLSIRALGNDAPAEEAAPAEDAAEE